MMYQEQEPAAFDEAAALAVLDRMRERTNGRTPAAELATADAAGG